MAVVLAQLEGVVETAPQKVGNDAVFQVLGVTVVVKPKAAARRRIRASGGNPRLTIDELVDTRPLPGRSEAGFLGCTAIVVGNYDTDTKTLEVNYPPTTPIGLPAGAPFEPHPFLEIGPPETLLLGPCTRTVPGPLTVNHVPVEILATGADPGNRITPDGPKNEYGLSIDPSRIPFGAPVTVEGYPSTDTGAKRVIGVVVSVDSDDPSLLVDSINPQIGITLASGRNRTGDFDVEVRGGLYTGQAAAGAVAPQRITIQRLNAVGAVEGTPPGFLSTTANAPAGGFDTWRARGNVTGTPQFPTAPVGVQATYVNAPAGTRTDKEEDMDIRDDPKTMPTEQSPP